MSNSRKRIEKAAKDLGIKIHSLEWESVTSLEMGDCLGGWLIRTDAGDYGAINADSIINYMRENWTLEPEERKQQVLDRLEAAGRAQGLL